MNLGGAIRINKCALLTGFGLLLFIYYIGFSDSGEGTKTLLHYANLQLNRINVRKLLIASIQAAQLGGQEVLAISKHPEFGVKSKGKTKEGANDPVTEADFQSHCVMRQGLLRFFPRLQIVSEEDGSGRKCPEHRPYDLDSNVLHEHVQLHDQDEMAFSADDVTVWIDPLDATQEYTEKLFDYVTTMVCVAVRGHGPIIGIIHNPFTGVTTWAWHGTGAMSENLIAVAEAQRSRPKEAEAAALVPPMRLIVSRSHTGNVANVSKVIFGPEAQVTHAGGAGFKVLQVVNGKADAYLHTTAIKKWDVCAGDAILRALGGKMTTLEDAELEYEGPPVSPVNSKGIVAALKDHHRIVSKIMESKQLA